MPIDPVCGMSVHALFAVAEYEYQGRRFFFCSRSCRDAFVRAPQRYVSAEEPPAMTRPPRARPHPEDSSPTTGGCCLV